MARYLLAASPLPGHVLPLLEIGADLVRRGNSVTLLTGAEFTASATRAGLTSIPLEESARPQASPRSGDAGMVRQLRRGRADIRSVYIAPLLAQFRALNDLLGEQTFDAIVVDIAFTGAIALLNRDARPPIVVCGISPLALSSVDTAPFGMGRQPEPGVDHTAMNRVVHRVLFGDVQARLNRTLRAAGAENCPVFLTDWPKLADRMLQFTVPSFEYPRSDLPDSVIFTGPVLPTAYDEDAQTPELRDRLDGSATVIHVTQGTWDNADLHQLVAPTLRAFADVDGVTVVVATGGVPIPDDVAVPANAYVTDFVPYSFLLPHVDVMITNGGYGGVQFALRHGVPLVVAGRSADKPEVAARVEFAGVGIDLGTSTPTPEAVAAAVARIRSDDRFRTAARGVASAMGTTSAMDTITAVLAQLTEAAGRQPA